MSKTKKRLISFLGILSIIIIFTLVILFVHTKFFGVFSGTEKQTVKLYFLDTTLSKLSFEEQSVVKSDGDNLYNIVRLLIKGPENNVENKRAIPENTKILSLTRKGSLATVDFSSEFNTGSTADDMLAAFTVVYTLCGVDGINQVSILVAGEPLVDTDKKPLGALAKNDIVNENDHIEKQNTIELTLYFPNLDSTKLIRETRSVVQNDNISTAQLIVSELMQDSASGAHDTLIPKNAKLSSIETKDSTCFVNFSKEFIDRKSEEDANEIMTIYAIVNSLTELNDIKKVQFLIEGQKVENYGSVIFSQPFERSENIIAK